MGGALHICSSADGSWDTALQPHVVDFVMVSVMDSVAGVGNAFCSCRGEMLSGAGRGQSETLVLLALTLTSVKRRRKTRPRLSMSEPAATCRPHKKPEPAPSRDRIGVVAPL